MNHYIIAKPQKIAGLLMSLILMACAGQAKSLREMSVDELAKAMGQGLQYQRILVVQTLGRIRSKASVGVLIQTMLHDKSKPVRRAAQRALINVKDERVYKALQAGVEDHDRWVRLAAIDALSAVKDPRSFNLLLHSLRRFPKDHTQVLLTLESLRSVAFHIEPDPGVEKALLPWLRDKHEKIRETAIIILTLMARPDVLPDLMALWDRGSVRARILLCDAFANIGYKEPLPLLLQALKVNHRSLVMHALYALAQIQSTQALPAIWSVMKTSEDEQVLMACLYALTEIPDERSIPLVTKLLGSHSPTVLHWAMSTLGSLNAEDAVLLISDKLHDPHSMVRATAATVLGELHALPAENVLVQRLADPKETEEVKIAVAKALMAMKSKKGNAYFWKALQNPDLNTSVHLTYALALANSDGAAFHQQFLKRLQAKAFSTRLVAAVALGVMGDKHALPLLTDALDHGYPRIRRFAILGLESIADQRAIRALADTANDDKDPLVRILCAGSLMSLGRPEYEVLLWDGLESKSEDIRTEALIGLGQHMNEVIRQKLKWYLRREPSVPVRQTLNRLLERG